MSRKGNRNKGNSKISSTLNLFKKHLQSPGVKEILRDSTNVVTNNDRNHRLSRRAFGSIPIPKVLRKTLTKDDRKTVSKKSHYNISKRASKRQPEAFRARQQYAILRCAASGDIKNKTEGFSHKITTPNSVTSSKNAKSSKHQSHDPLPTCGCDILKDIYTACIYLNDGINIKHKGFARLRKENDRTQKLKNLLKFQEQSLPVKEKQTHSPPNKSHQHMDATILPLDVNSSYQHQLLNNKTPGMNILVDKSGTGEDDHANYKSLSPLVNVGQILSKSLLPSKRTKYEKQEPKLDRQLDILSHDINALFCSGETQDLPGTSAEVGHNVDDTALLCGNNNEFMKWLERKSEDPAVTLKSECSKHMEFSVRKADVFTPDSKRPRKKKRPIKSPSKFSLNRRRVNETDLLDSRQGFFIHPPLPLESSSPESVFGTPHLL